VKCHSLVTNTHKGEEMSVISRKIKAKVKMIEMGIIPAFTGHELTRMMNTLSQEEKRIAKRKFRKVWRKLKNNLHENEMERIVPDGGNPTKSHLRNRTCMVISSIMKEV